MSFAIVKNADLRLSKEKEMYAGGAMLMTRQKKNMQGVRYSDEYLKKSMAEYGLPSAAPYARHNARVEISRMTMQEVKKFSRQIGHDTLKSIMNLIDHI